MQGVLHTNSAYFSSGGWLAEKAQHFDTMDIMNSFDEAYHYAREEELKFYHSFFDVDTYDAFIRELRNLFNKAQGDGERIRSLSNANLNNFIPKSNNMPQYDYQVIITGEHLCEQIPIELWSSDNISVEGGPIYLSVNLRNLSTIKNIVNQEIKKRRFDPSSSNMRNIKDYFGEIIGKTAEQEVTQKLTENISISKTKTDPNLTIKLEDEIENGFLFSSSFGKGAKQERQAILNGYYGDGYQKKFRQDMQEAINKIKNFIFNKCLQVNNGTLYNGVNILKKAAEETWAEVIDSKPLESQDFFFEGENLYKSILGKGGEFQLSLQDKYIRMVLGQTNAKLGHIIGDIIKDGRKEPRSDFQLILELGGDIGNVILGIQSKNISSSSMQEVKINTDLGLIAPNLGTNFTDAIVNSYFNTDILFETHNMTEYLKEYLNTYFWKAMNLNVGTNLDPYHTNTFYWAGGSALVPASTIIETLNREMITNPEFNITKAPWKSLSDVEFLQDAGDGDPIFTEYWHGSFDHWTPLFQNYRIYQQLLENTRIHTRFSMARIFTVNGGMAAFEFLNG